MDVIKQKWHMEWIEWWADTATPLKNIWVHDNYFEIDT